MRTTTVKAQTRCHFWRLDGSALLKLEEQWPEEIQFLRSRAVENFLKYRNIKLRPLTHFMPFSIYKREFIDFLATKVVSHCVQEGELLHDSSKDLDTIWLIQAGRVLVVDTFDDTVFHE